MHSIKGKHDLLIRLLKEFGREYTVSGENAGVHVLVHLPRGLSEAEAVQQAKRGWCARVRAGTVLHRRCRRSRTQGGTVLLGYAGLSEGGDCRGSCDSEKVLECVKKDMKKTDCFASNKN